MTKFRRISKPGKSEYPSYSAMYMKLVKIDGSLLKHMRDNFIKIKEFIYSLSEDKLYYRYAKGKWSIKEILVHIIDDERIFSYRALRYARFDNTPLHEFEQDHYALCSGANERSLENIFDEYEAVRSATIAMFNGFPEEAFMRNGGLVGNTDNNRSVRALAYHIAGHELHHINIIKERYLDSQVANEII